MLLKYHYHEFSISMGSSGGTNCKSCSDPTSGIHNFVESLLGTLVAAGDGLRSHERECPYIPELLAACMQSEKSGTNKQSKTSIDSRHTREFTVTG